MADLSALLANAAQTNADFDLGKINKSYWEGQDQYAKNQLREAFKDGVPVGPDGQPDYGAMAKVLFQKGDIAGGVGLAGAAAGQGDRALYANGGTPQPQANIVSPPSINRTASSTVAPALNKGGVAPQDGGQGQGGVTPASFLQKNGIQPGYNMEVGLAAFKRAGIDPDQMFDPNDPAVASKLGPVVQRLKGVGQIQPPQPGDNPPQAAPQAQPIPQQVAQAAPQPVQQPTVVPPADAELRRLRYLASSPDKATATAALSELKAIREGQQPTDPMKEAAGSGLTLQQYQERQGEQAAAQAGATERAKADVKEQQEYIESGKAASQRLTTLNAISNVVNSDKAPGMGYAGDTELKVKMALQRLGFDFGDLSGAQLMQKMNASLAAEMAKSLTARSTQFEFKTFLANNPGLLLDKTGNQRLIGIFSQLAKRDADLGKLARQNQDNWQNWDQVVEKYDAQKDHRIIDPISKQPISTNSIVAPAPTEKAATPALEPGKTMVNGHIYKGGNPNQKSSWELRS